MEKISSAPQIWLYEVWSPLHANRVVPIDSAIETKLQAIQAYQGTHDNVDYSSHFLGLAKYRSLLLKEEKYAEAYLVVERPFFLEIKQHATLPLIPHQTISFPALSPV